MHDQKRFTFSVIIPTYNRPGILPGCLQALAEQNYPVEKFEVIVVDDGCEADLSEIIAPYKKRINISYLKQKNQGPSAARNFGAQSATGELLAFTDDDCRAEPEWLIRLNEGFQKDSPAMVGGKTINILTKNIFSTSSQHIVDVVYQHYNADPDNARFFASNNIAIKKDLYLKLGGFDTSFHTSEDRELCDRLLFKGCRLQYFPKAKIMHRHKLSLLSYCKQHFGYGRGAYRFHNLRAKRGSGKMVNELSFYRNLWSWFVTPLREKDKSTGIKIFIIMVVWQMMNIAGFVFEAINRKKEKNGD